MVTATSSICLQFITVFYVAGGKLPKRYADFDRNKPFVASITITPIAKG